MATKAHATDQPLGSGPSQEESDAAGLGEAPQPVPGPVDAIWNVDAGGGAAGGQLGEHVGAHPEQMLHRDGSVREQERLAQSAVVGRRSPLDAAPGETKRQPQEQRALAEYVPGSLRRARSQHFIDPDLQTAEELTARQALDELSARYAEEKTRLEQALQEARTHAEPVRYGLLYSTGAQLVHAVAQVLADADLFAIDLDKELGGTKSADLLVSVGRPPWGRPGASLRLSPRAALLRNDSWATGASP